MRGTAQSIQYPQPLIERIADLKQDQAWCCHESAGRQGVEYELKRVGGVLKMHSPEPGCYSTDGVKRHTGMYR